MQHKKFLQLTYCLTNGMSRIVRMMQQQGFNHLSVAILRWTRSLEPCTYVEWNGKIHPLSGSPESLRQMSWDSLWQIEHCISANHISQSDSPGDIQVLMSEYETQLAYLGQSGSLCMQMIEVQVHSNFHHRPTNAAAMPQISWYRYPISLRVSLCQIGWVNMQWSIGHNDMCPGLSGAQENPGHFFLTDQALHICQSHLSIKTD